MNLPGLFVEYLITGLTTLGWAWWLLWAAYPDRIMDVTQLSPAHVAVSASVAYILGMMVDHAGARMTRIVDKLAKRRRGVATEWLATLSAEGSECVRILGKAEITARSAEVGKQYELRKSRDRVARGFFANSVIAAISGLVFTAALNPPLRYVWTPVCLLAATLAYAEWIRSAVATWSYQVAASRALLRIDDEIHGT